MHRDFYRFGGMTLALESPEELTDSALCRPFRTAEGTAEHTIGLTFSDRLPQPHGGDLRPAMNKGKLVVISGPSGIGKSTQAALWQRYAGAEIVNGDRALVRPDTGTVSGVFYAGTSGISRNVTAPLQAVALLEQGSENRITALRPQEAFARLLSQCAYYQRDAASAARMTELAAQRGFTVGCAHFNHGLRGTESDRDEAFVRTQCAHLGVPFYAGRGDVASVRGVGTEGAARQLRYAFLTDCAAAHGYDWIATAHTADDNAETLLLNLARGCGLRGLTGIPPQRGKLLRPMLDTTRAEAEAYLAAHGIAHVEDSTNASDAYARNRVRHHAVPALESVNAAFVQHAADTAALLREDERFLGGLAAEFLAGQTPAEGIPTAELLALPRPVRVRVLQQAAGRELSRRHLLALEQLCGGEGPGYADMPGRRSGRMRSSPVRRRRSRSSACASRWGCRNRFVKFTARSPLLSLNLRLSMINYLLRRGVRAIGSVWQGAAVPSA